jgi:hypothetical protein
MSYAFELWTITFVEIQIMPNLALVINVINEDVGRWWWFNTNWLLGLRQIITMSKINCMRCILKMILKILNYNILRWNLIGVFKLNCMSHHLFKCAAFSFQITPFCHGAQGIFVLHLYTISEEKVNEIYFTYSPPLSVLILLIRYQHWFSTISLRARELLKTSFFWLKK